MEEIKEDGLLEPVEQLIHKPKIYKLSVSKIKTFETCKAKFRFSYIDHLPKKDWDFLVFGKFAHEVLEKFYLRIIAGDVRLDHIIMSEVFKESFANWKDKLTKQQVDDIKVMVQQYLVRRSDERKNNKSPVVTEVEKKFLININDEFAINGFIDRIQIDPDGVLRVSDYKTSKDKKYLEKDFFQLLTYCYVMLKEQPDLKKIRVSYIMLKHNFDEIVKEFTPETILKVEKKFIQRYDEMQKERLYRPKPSPLCKYCDYADRCPGGIEFLGQKDGSFVKFGKEK